MGREMGGGKGEPNSGTSFSGRQVMGEVLGECVSVGVGLVLGICVRVGGEKGSNPLKGLLEGAEDLLIIILALL